MKFVVHLSDLYELLAEMRADLEGSGFRLRNLNLDPFLGNNAEVLVDETVIYFLDGIPCPLVELLKETETGYRLI